MKIEKREIRIGDIVEGYMRHIITNAFVIYGFLISNSFQIIFDKNYAKNMKKSKKKFAY